MLERVAEMVIDVMEANGLEVDDFISVIFTATSDLVSEFPAYAARQLGFGDVPLICARELEIEGSMPRVVRMMAHVETDLPRADITHVYLHGAAALRRDLTRVRAVPDDVSLAERSTGPVQVVGAGLLGTSIGLALRRPGVEVLLARRVARAPAHRHRARRRPARDRRATGRSWSWSPCRPDHLGDGDRRAALTRRPTRSSPTSAASRPAPLARSPARVAGARAGTSAATRWPAASGPGRWRPAPPCSTAARGRSRRTTASDPDAVELVEALAPAVRRARRCG